MRSARLFPLRGVVVLLALTGLALTMLSAHLAVTQGSKLLVKGTSTVHDWTCEVIAFEGGLEADQPGSAENLLNSLKTVDLRIPARSIECRNGTMNQKARNALKMEQHPQIQYVLQQAQVQGVEANGTVTVRTAGRLTLAGITRPVEATVQGQMRADGSLQVTGSVPLLLSDYGITPPTAMLGTLKTGNRVEVVLDVRLR